MQSADFLALAYTFTLTETHLEWLSRIAKLSAALCYLAIALQQWRFWRQQSQQQKTEKRAFLLSLLPLAFFLTGALGYAAGVAGGFAPYLSPEIALLWQSSSDALHAISALTLTVVSAFVGANLFALDCAQREYQQLMQLAIDSIPATIFWKDKNSVYRGCNQAFANDAGVPTPADIVGKTDYDLSWKPEETEFFLKVDRQVMDSNTPEYRIIEPLQQADGTQTWVETNKIPLRDPSGKVIGILGTYEEITERKRAASEQARLLKIVESSLNEIYIFNRQDLRLQYANAGALRNLGYSLESLQKMTPVDIDTAINEATFRQKIALLLQRDRDKLVYKTVHQRADGSVYPVETTLQLIESDGESVVLAIVADITERQLSENALRENEEKLRIFVEHTPAAVAMFDSQMRYLLVSRRWLEDYGLGDRNIVGESHYDIFPNVPDRWKEIHQRCLAGAVEKCDEDPFPREDGSTDWVKWEIHPWRTGEGKIGGLILTTELITARKRAEQTLQASEQAFRTIFNSVYDAIFIHDIDGTIIDVNDKMLHLYGVDREEAKNFSIQRDYSQGDNSFEQLAEIWQKASQGEAQFFEWKARRPKDGAIFDAEVFLQKIVLNNREVILANVRDISDRAAAEKALKESEERFRLLVDGVKDYAIILLDPDGRVASWNAGAERIKGYKAEAIIGQNFSKFYTPEDIQQNKPARELQKARTLGRFEEEGERVRKDGSKFWANVIITALRDASGQLRGFSKVTRDITDRVQGQAALQASERRFRALFDQAFQFIALLTPDGTVLEANQTALDLGGFHSAEIVGRRFWEIPWWADKNRQELAARSEELAIDSEELNAFSPTPHSSRSTEHSALSTHSTLLKTAIASAAGGKFFRDEVLARAAAAKDAIALDLSVKPVQDESGRVVLLLVEGRDITSAKQTQQALQQLAAELEKRVDERTADLAESNAQLKQQIRDRVQAQEELAKLAAQRQAEADSLNQAVYKLLGEIQGAAKGDLSVRSQIDSGILGAVADSFNFLIASLGQVVTGIQHVAEQVRAGTSESIANTGELARLSRHQAQQIEATLQQIERMVASIRDVSDLSSRAEKVALKAAQTAGIGGSAVDRTVEGINELRSTISQTSKMIKRLGESSQQIGKIVTSISQIAAQTNLLALNATIEAARAGEQGLGFAVVAEEVRKLAERSAEASEEISEIVQSIRGEIGRVMEAMEAGTREVVAGTQLAAEAKTHLVAIIEVSREMNALVQNITQAAQKQTASAEEIADIVQEVNQISTTTAQKAREVTSSLDALAVAVNQLQSSVVHFQT